jgi:FKBP-type peptidyl-prolyl cis-trans isomerase 2
MFRNQGDMTHVALICLLPLVSAFVSPKVSFLQRTETTTELFMAAEKGTVVTIDCRLRPEGDFVPEPLFDGIVLDDSDTAVRLAFVLGEGNYLPGLHDLVSTMKEGEHIENVSLDAGWGAWNPNLKVSTSFDSLKNSGLDTSLIKEGVELAMANGMNAIVTDIFEDKFVIDANPPLAGASYLASVELLSVEPGPVELQYSPNAGSDCKYQVASFALGKFFFPLGRIAPSFSDTFLRQVAFGEVNWHS